MTLLISTILIPIASTMNINKNNQEEENDLVTMSSFSKAIFPSLPRILNRDWNYWSNKPNLIMIPEGNVGIGTSEPDEKLHIFDKAGLLMLHIENDNYPTGRSAISLENREREYWLYLDNYNHFRIFDRTAQTNPFEIEPACDNHLLYLKSGKLVGVNTLEPVTTLDVNGGFSTNVRIVNQNTEARNTDHTLLVNTSDSSKSIELPYAYNAEGQILVIKKIDISGNIVKIKPLGSAKIDGYKTISLSIPYQSITIQSDGTNWWIISEFK